MLEIHCDMIRSSLIEKYRFRSSWSHHVTGKTLEVFTHLKLYLGVPGHHGSQQVRLDVIHLHLKRCIAINVFSAAVSLAGVDWRHGQGSIRGLRQAAVPGVCWGRKGLRAWRSMAGWQAKQVFAAAPMLIVNEWVTEGAQFNSGKDSTLWWEWWWWRKSNSTPSWRWRACDG